MFILVISVIILTTIACPSYICASNITCCDQHSKIALSLQTIENTLKKFTPGLDYLGELPTHSATSCQQIAQLRPNLSSGFYWIQVNSSPLRVYCNMKIKECGAGTWTRIANINMTLPSSKCPRGLGMVTSPKRSCRKTVDTGSSSANFSTFGIPYSNICGMVIGYQYGSPDAFSPYHSNRHYTVDNCFVDGVILSYNYPRQHIWTFAAQPDGIPKNSVHSCPCQSNNNRYLGTVPRFVGDDYFCETGVHTGKFIIQQYYTEHPLWDGKGCGTFPNGCEGTRSPWFKKQFPYIIVDDVELRICMDEGRSSNEDVLVEQIYLYIQ